VTDTQRAIVREVLAAIIGRELEKGEGFSCVAYYGKNIKGTVHMTDVELMRELYLRGMTITRCETLYRSNGCLKTTYGSGSC